MTRKVAAIAGATVASPPYAARSRVCVRSYRYPTMRNSAPVEMPWFTICRTAPLTASGVSADRPSITNPRCATEE